MTAPASPGPRTPTPAAPDDSTRRCARGAWCKDAEVVTIDGHPYHRGKPTFRPFCDRDEGVIARCLDELPGQFRALGEAIGDPVRSGQPIHVPFGPSIPLRVDVDALMRLIVEALASWHERIADRKTLHFPAVGLSKLRRDTIAVHRAVTALSGSFGVLLALDPAPVRRSFDLRDIAHYDHKTRTWVTSWPDETSGIVHTAFAELNLPYGGREAGLEILHLHYLTRSRLGETKPKPDELEGIACRNCNKRTLVRAEPPSNPNDPGKHSDCLSCGHRMTETQYREWVKLCHAHATQARRVPVLEFDTLPGLPESSQVAS